MAWPGRVTGARSSTVPVLRRLPLACPGGRRRSSRARGAGRRGAGAPSTARSRDRLAFVRHLWDPDIYRLRLGRLSDRRSSSRRSTDACRSTRRTAGGSPSSPGEPGDREEIWLADADGSNPTRLTRGPGGWQGSPRWSPDGRSIAFDSQARGRPMRHLDDRRRRLGTAPGHARARPTRSCRAGRATAASSTSAPTGRVASRSGASRPGAAAEEQVTREGGSVPFESFDGRTLYYLRAARQRAARPADGGRRGADDRPCVDARSYAVAPRGIFHVDCTAPDAPVPAQRILRYWDAATGQDRPVATFEASSIVGLSASPDGQSILYGAQQRGHVRPDDDRELP